MWYNPIIKAILYSPLHGMVSGSILLITVTGRKSGKQYTFPVSYFRDEEDEELLTIFSPRKRTWWRNLNDGAEVTVRLRGKVRHGYAEVIDADQETILEAMQASYSRMMKEEQIAELAPKLVMIELELEAVD